MVLEREKNKLFDEKDIKADLEGKLNNLTVRRRRGMEQLHLSEKTRSELEQRIYENEIQLRDHDVEIEKLNKDLVVKND